MRKSYLLWLGVAVVGVGGYFLWKKSQKPKSFANLTSKKSGGVLDTSQCAGPVEVLTYNPFEQPVRCHYACEGKDGDIINLGGNPPCPQAV